MTLTLESKRVIKSFLEDQGAGNSNIEAARQLLRSRAKQDFYFFQRHVYGNVDTDTDLHRDMCKRWQKRRKVKFSITLVPRFHLKTSCLTEAGNLWEFIIDPHQRALIINAKLDNAKDILANIENCVSTNEVFRWLFPEYCPDLVDKKIGKRCKWGVHRLDFPCSRYAGKKEGCIEIMGVEASLVSKHYDLMIFDDPVNDINTATKEYRNKIHKWYRNALQLRHDLKSRVRLIGTRWDFDDLYGRLIKEENARREKQKKNGDKVKPRYWVYHRQIVEKVNDDSGETIAGYSNVRPIWPERFDAEDITELREENGSYVFGCQFMNAPVSDEDAVFKYKDIKFIDEYLIPEDCVNFIATDTAVEDTEDGDFWVITVGSFDRKGNMYIRHIVREKLLPSSFLNHVIELAQQWNVERVSVETTAFQKTVFKTYQEMAVNEGANIPWVEVNRARSSKRKRHYSLQPRVERGQFYIQEGIDNSDYAVEEMITCPRPVYDDILDTLADLEYLFYKVPDEIEEKISRETFEGFYGKLDQEEEDEFEMSSSVINCEELIG